MDISAWDIFANYAQSLGLDPSQFQNDGPDTLPDEWFATATTTTTGVPQYVPGSGPTAADVKNDLITDPSYQFRLNEGLSGIERAKAALGQRFSGGMLKDLTKYAQDYASNEYNNAYNRLAGMSGTGSSTATSLANLGQNYGNSMGNIYSNMGSAQANALLTGGLANMGNYSGLGGLWSNAFNNFTTTPTWTNWFGG